ncbi:hypothetical protein NQL31_002996 [Lotmaria passim]
MSASYRSAALSAADTATSEGSIGNSIVQTPVAATGTTIFLREEGSAVFMPLYHQTSVTLRDLAEEFNISSVLECDAQGNVQPRAVAFDSPSDILHSGRHYIARRDAKAEPGSSCVTFKGKIFVKEYELEHPTPAIRSVKTVSNADWETAEDVSCATHRPWPVATPFADKQRQQQALDLHEDCSATHANDVGTPQLQRMAEEEEEPTISRALALSSERKRPREDSMPKPAVLPQANRSAKHIPCENTETAQDGSEEKRDVLSFQTPTLRREVVLHDRTNSSVASPHAAAKMSNAPFANEAHADEPADAQPSATAASSSSSTAVPPPSQKQSLRFIPFTATGADGAETYVTLESLQQMCSDLSTQEAEFQAKHRAATDILESARRVLFLNDGKD